MNMTKKININFSSLVGLKAELLRKQAEVSEVKLKTEPTCTLPQFNKKKNKKTVEQGTKRNINEMIDTEDIAAHKKSRLMLEAKARLYDRLKKSKNDDKFLVDFKNKEDESEDEEFVDEEAYKEHPIEPEDNWVEYQDCFGRTRKCLREDLPHMQKKDDLIKQEIMRRGNNDNDRDEENMEQYSSVQEKEPEIEIMRRKWEEQTRKLEDKADIHYQDVLFDEARTHGVGYYAFSQDEKERTKQQENLANLRKETEKKQKETKENKELKERIEQNRLKAARIRQRIRAGLPAEPTEDELTGENKLIDSTSTTSDVKIEEVNNEFTDATGKSSEETTNKSTKENSTTDEKILEDEDKIRAFGELLDKKNHWHVMSQEEWVYKCREQRNKEFAPVYANFIHSGTYNGNQIVNGQISCEDDNKLDRAETNDYSETALGSHVLQDIDIPLPDENNSTSATFNDNSTCISTQDAIPRTINVDNIMAGLKYLREKFEESHSK